MLWAVVLYSKRYISGGLGRGKSSVFVFVFFHLKLFPLRLHFWRKVVGFKTSNFVPVRMENIPNQWSIVKKHVWLSVVAIIKTSMGPGMDLSHCQCGFLCCVCTGFCNVFLTLLHGSISTHSFSTFSLLLGRYCLCRFHIVERNSPHCDL